MLKPFLVLALLSGLAVSSGWAADAVLPSTATTFERAVAHLKGRGALQDTPTALDLFEKAGKQGDARAQVWIASMHREPTRSSRRAALKWARKAADQGHPAGQYLVGAYYLSAKPTQKNLAMASEWMTRAAAQGQRDAMMALASMSAEGLGREASAVDTYYWTKLAADAKLEYALYALRKMQALPDRDRTAAEARASSFKAVLERPELFKDSDLILPNVKPGRRPVPEPTPSPTPTVLDHE